MSQAATNPAGAVVVTFHPDLEQLERLLASLEREAIDTLVVDNTPGEPSDALVGLCAGRAELSAGRGNTGVAAAINRGVEHWRRAGKQYALLLDQDSLPDPGLATALVDALRSLDSGEHPVAAVGPVIRDRASGKRAPFMRFALPLNRRLHPTGTESLRCDYLITSGTLLNLRHWERIGPMREHWFIDNIDLEWSFRARRLGYELHGTAAAELEHSIGESRQLLPGKPAPRYRHHGPERLYTMMRNRVFLYRSGAPRAWVVQDLLRAAGKLVLFSLVRPRRANLASMLRGLRDGMRQHP